MDASMAVTSTIGRWFGAPERFQDRRDAGRQLAQYLTAYAHQDDVLVLALPRGGAPVAFEVASVLRAPLDVWLVRKLGVPGHEELAMGAIADGGGRVLSHDIISDLGITPDEIDRVATLEQRELERRLQEYRGGLPPAEVAGRSVILVDDGLATGATMRAAVQSIRRLEPHQIVVAVPVAPAAVVREFEGRVDAFVSVLTPKRFGAVGLWYDDFSPTSDDEVRDLLEAAARRRRQEQPDAGPR
jgi:putative phosphoribosyl transferase